MSPRLRILAALALGCTGAAAVLAAACAIHIGGLVAPLDAETHDADAGADADAEPSDAPMSCMGQTCDSNAQCCGDAPSCITGGTCAATCVGLDAGQCGPPECCLGLFCENYCRFCHGDGDICTSDNSCCNGKCVDSGTGLFCR